MFMSLLLVVAPFLPAAESSSKVSAEAVADGNSSSHGYLSVLAMIQCFNFKSNPDSDFQFLYYWISIRFFKFQSNPISISSFFLTLLPGYVLQILLAATFSGRGQVMALVVSMQAPGMGWHLRHHKNEGFMIIISG